MFWKILLFLVAWFIGQATQAFTITMPLCCLRVGIVFSNRVRRCTGIDMRRVKRRYRNSMLLWVIIDLIIAFLLVKFVPSLFIAGFCGGTIFMFLISFRKTGVNEQNLYEYVKFAVQKLSEPDQAVFLGCVEEYIEEHDIIHELQI